MWKLLRNSILAAVLIAAVLKLVLWYEIQQGAARLAAQLAPIGQLQYGSVSAALNGGVELGAVTLTLGKGKLRETWRATQVDIETPGAFWLGRRLMLSDDSLPEHLIVSIKGLQAPVTALPADLAWLSPISLVPFETLGCGVVSRFSVADYQRMGLNPGVQQQRVEYRYDAAASTLSFVADLASPPFSNVALHGELQKFDPHTVQATGWNKLHVVEAGLSYNDAGYFAKRNRFCAQQAGINQAQFVAQHAAAVDAFLADRGIQMSSEIGAVYRSLVSDGGRVSILSLPAAASTVGQLLAETPDVMTRQLNLTARRNDGPPVMLRVAFRPPPIEEPGAVALTAPVASSGTPPAASAPPPTSAPILPAAKPPTSPGAPPATTAAAPRPAPPIVVSPTPAAVPARPAAAVAAAPAPTRPAVPPPANQTPQKPVESSAAPSALPSTPPPPDGSTLALVWKSEIDRLDKPAPAPLDYDVVEYQALLSGYVGRFVRLRTATGKKVEGTVINVDATTLGLHVKKPGGSADLQVPRSVIVEIRVPRARPSADNG